MTNGLDDQLQKVMSLSNQHRDKEVALRRKKEEEEEEGEEEEEEGEEEEEEEVHPQALLSTLGTAMSLGSPTSHTVPQRGRGLAKILHSDWPTLNGKTNVPTLQDKMQPVKPCRWSLTDV